MTWRETLKGPTAVMSGDENLDRRIVTKMPH
jgi:hypothetical protein